MPYVTRRCTLRDRRRVTVPAAATPARRIASPITISASPISQRNGEVPPGITSGIPRKSSGNQPRWRNSTAPICAGIDCSVALTPSGIRPGLLNELLLRATRRCWLAAMLCWSTGFFLFPRREECSPLIGDGNRFSLVRYGDVHYRRITYHHVALIPNFLPDDEARVAHGGEACPDAQIVARESLCLVRRLDLTHHRPQARLHVFVVGHVLLQRRPARPLEQGQHVRVIYVSHRVTVARINVNLHVFCHQVAEGVARDES